MSYMNSLIAWYDMSNINPPNLAPRTYGSYNGTGVGLDASTDIVNGIAGGKGIEFNGIDEYFTPDDIVNNFAIGSFSIAVWFKAVDGQPATNGSLYGVTDTTGVVNIVNLILRVDGKFDFNYGSNSNTETARTKIAILSDGAEPWHHIVCVVDATIEGPNGMLYYFDGELGEWQTGTGDTTGIVSADFNSADSFLVGARNQNATPSDHFDGCMDEVMIFDAALTETQIKDLREQQMAGRL